MIMYDNFKCDRCNETYKGKFVFKRNGEVECFDCDSKEIVVSEILWEDGQNESAVKNNLMRETVTNMLLDDVQEIYRAESVKGEDYVDQFLKKDGTIDENKLFYQGNPIDLVIEGKKIAYIAMRYLEGTKEKHRKIAIKLLDIYKSFREITYTEDEVLEVWEMYYSDEVVRLVESSFD